MRRDDIKLPAELAITYVYTPKAEATTQMFIAPIERKVGFVKESLPIFGQADLGDVKVGDTFPTAGLYIDERTDKDGVKHLWLAIE